MAFGAEDVRVFHRVAIGSVAARLAVACCGAILNRRAARGGGVPSDVAIPQIASCDYALVRSGRRDVTRLAPRAIRAPVHRAARRPLHRGVR
jgi:hypothetical protein